MEKRCLWEVFRGIIHLEFSKRIQTVKAHLYIQLLEHVHRSLGKKRPAHVNMNRVSLLTRPT